MNEWREASTGDPGPLLHKLYVGREPIGEGPACHSVAGRSVEENTQFSLVESFGENRLVECMRETERLFLAYHFRICLGSMVPAVGFVFGLRN